MKILMNCVIAASTVLLASCASTGDVPSVKTMLSDATAQNGRACIRQTDIQGFGVLKGDIVSIDGRRNYYLATVLPGCTDLQTSMRAYFGSDFYEVCGGRMDKMVTRDNHCVIKQIYKFDNREEAFAVYNGVVEERDELKAGASD